jgi:1,2-diacylglycerol 3-alpha-glucosyltransferase
LSSQAFFFYGKLKAVRIGLFTDSYLPRMDGIAISVESFRVGLESLGHTVYVFCPKRPERFTEPTDRIYRFSSIPSISNYDQYRDTFPFTPKHIRAVSKLNLDVIHTFTPAQIGMFGVFIAKRNHIPLVTTCSADFELIYDYKRLVVFPLTLAIGTSLAAKKIMSPRKLFHFFKPSYPFIKWLDRSTRISAGFFNDQCDITTVPSIKTEKEIAPFMKQKPIVLPCGTDLGLVPKERAKNLRKKYGLPEEVTLFVSASRLVREKRIDFIVRAFANLSIADQKKSALVIVGDGVEMKAIKYLAERLGILNKVIFTGRLEHKYVLEVVAACDIYVHASLRETQGLVLNEAAACGKPIIMIDREVNDILHDGKNGLFAENKITSFGKAMTRLVGDKELRYRFGKKSEEYAQKTGLKEAAKPLSDLYGSLLHN